MSVLRSYNAEAYPSILHFVVIPKNLGRLILGVFENCMI